MSAETHLSSGTALLFDRSERLRMTFSGPKAAESLTGLVTNDVLALRGGDGLYACALTAKGRIIADVRIVAMAADDQSSLTFLVDANKVAGIGFTAMITKYVNPRLAKYTNVTASTACLTVTGDGAARALTSVGIDAMVLEEIVRAAPFTHRTTTVGGTRVQLVCVPDLGQSPTFDVHCSRAESATVHDVLLAAGAVAADESEWHRRRVLAARPEWGIDMDETTLAQEANMDVLQAISYNKGCYTGQETVARVHFRGHVNRTLRRVTFQDGIEPSAATAITAPDGAVVGDVRSCARDDTGALIGLAMLRREVLAGAELVWADAVGVSHTVSVVDSAT